MKTKEGKMDKTYHLRRGVCIFNLDEGERKRLMMIYLISLSSALKCKKMVEISVGQNHLLSPVKYHDIMTSPLLVRMTP